MKGYVKNISLLPQYIMKRNVNPSGVIPAADIEAAFYTRSGTKNTSSFVKWLRGGIFSETTVWEINIVDDVEKDDKKSEAPSKKDNKSRRESVVNLSDEKVIPKVTAAYLVKVSSEKCKELASKCSDTKVLQDALQKANTMPRKSKTCKVLRDRLDDLR
jgi:hypothetical protein